MSTNTATAIQQTATSNAPATEARPKYVLDHSDAELRRLESQGRFLAPSTKDFFCRVGITTGMRVLDVGCGAGDVSFILADLVGPTGEVVGFDRAEAAISTAAARAQAKGLTNVRFVQCEIDQVKSLADDGLFDAAVSRLVIIHQPKPLEALRKVLRAVRPGGVVGFQEPDLALPYWSTTKLTLMEEMGRGIMQLVEAGYIPGDLCNVFTTAFNEAGITQRRIIRTGAIESASEEAACKWIVDVARIVHGLTQKLGLRIPAYDPKTFDVDLHNEVASKHAAFTPLFWLGAAGRLPAVRAVES